MNHKQIVLTEDEANQLLNILSELPIRHLSIVQAVQRFLMNKFEEAQSVPEEIIIGKQNAIHNL